MKNKFKDDEVLAQLSKAARKTKAPKLDESIIQSAILSKPKFGPRKFLTPALMFNLAGGAAVLAGVFVFTGPLSPTAQEMVSSGTMDQFLRMEDSALLAQGNVEITEENLLAREGVSLAEHGLSAIGNYVSNSPAEYVDEIWTGQGGTETGNLWVFVVTDAVYIANDENSVPLSSFLTSENLGSAIGEDSSLGYGEQLASSSDADGIRLLVQGDNNILYPLVVPVNEEPGSLYSELLGKIVSDRFTKVPTF
jgi:hypothetical protein